MHGIQMSSVISDILVFLREELEIVVPNRTLPERLFNRAQLDLTVKSECFQFDIAMTLAAREIETGITAADGTTTRTILGALTYVTSPTHADYYNGWLLRNITAKGEAFITDSDPDNTNQELRLSHTIVGQIATDIFEVEKLAKYVDLPWYVIRPYLQKGVHWGTEELDPASLPEIKDLYGVATGNTQTGTPELYALENQRLWIYPQPTEKNVLRIAGHRRVADCIRSTLTSAGGLPGDTIIDTTIPLKPNDYYQGMKVLILSGTCIGEIQTIAQYDAANDIFYFEEPFTAQIASAVAYEILSPLPEEYRGLLEDYIKWQLLRRHKQFRDEAKYYETEYRAGMEEIEMIHARRSTANMNIGRRGKGIRFKNRARVIVS